MPFMLSLTGRIHSRWGEHSVPERVHSIAIVGPRERASKVARQLSEAAGERVRVAIFSDTLAFGAGNNPDAKAVSLESLIGLVRKGCIQRILLATPLRDHARTASILERLQGLAVDVDHVLDDFAKLPNGRNGSSDGVCTVPIMRKPLSPMQAAIKSGFDRIGATLLLVLTGPLMLCVALMVKLSSPGPVFFRQQRFGLNNEIFEVFKFRTLYHHRADLNAQQPVERNDVRITPVGKVLRALSIDELPQLLNVLKGNMSLVGPRPLPLGLRVEGRLCSDFPRYAARHRMRPGITGLAQIKGWRGGMDVRGKLEKRLEWDLEYIEQYSLMLDARILLGTAVALLRPTNAY